MESKCRYEFIYVYKLDFRDSILWKEVFGKEFSKHTVFQEQINDVITVTIEDDSDVRMSFIRDTDTSEIEHEVLMSFFCKDKP